MWIGIGIGISMGNIFSSVLGIESIKKCYIIWKYQKVSVVIVKSQVNWNQREIITNVMLAIQYYHTTVWFLFFVICYKLNFCYHQSLHTCTHLCVKFIGLSCSILCRFALCSCLIASSFNCGYHSFAVTADLKVIPSAGSDRAWVWNPKADYADEEAKSEQLEIRFASVESECTNMYLCICVWVDV